MPNMQDDRDVVDSMALAMFRSNVKQALKRERISISELGRRAGISRVGLSLLLSGKQDCSVRRAELISQALGVRLTDLLSA